MTLMPGTFSLRFWILITFLLSRHLGQDQQCLWIWYTKKTMCRYTFETANAIKWDVTCNSWGWRHRLAAPRWFKGWCCKFCSKVLVPSWAMLGNLIAYLGDRLRLYPIVLGDGVATPVIISASADITLSTAVTTLASFATSTSQLSSIRKYLLTQTPSCATSNRLLVGVILD